MIRKDSHHLTTVARFEVASNTVYIFETNATTDICPAANGDETTTTSIAVMNITL